MRICKIASWVMSPFSATTGKCQYITCQLDVLTKAERSPNRGGGSKVRRCTKQEAAADLVTHLALGERFGSQNELKKRYGVAKSTMSDWEANGLIPGCSQSGRCKQIADA